MVVSFCNLHTIWQNESNAAWLAQYQALIINTRTIACQKQRVLVLFFSRRAVLEVKLTMMFICIKGGRDEAKDAISAPVAPKSCYLRLLSVTVISHPFVFGIALNWLARACVFSCLTRHACACLLRISLSFDSNIFMIFDTKLN